MIELPQWSLKEAIALLDVDKLEVINLAVILGGISTDRNAMIHYSRWRTMVNVKDHPVPYHALVWSMAEQLHEQAKVDWMKDHARSEGQAKAMKWRDINND